MDDQSVREGAVHDGSNVTLSATDARAGRMTGRVRWILRLSMLLVVVGMVVAYMVS